MMGIEQKYHVLERTSPKGGEFIGRCTLCGAENLASKAVFEPCENPRLVTCDDAVIGAITGDHK